MEQARQFLTHFSGPQGYAIFFLLVTGCGVGFPFNSDLLLICASVLAALGYFDLKILMVLAFLALISGDSINFFVARKWGKKLLHLPPCRWLFTPQKIQTAEHYLNTKGTKFLFCVRFLPLIRTVLFFTAGSLQVKPSTFYLMNMSASAIYLPILMGASFYASSNIDQVILILKKFQFGLLGAVILTVTFLYFNQTKKSKLKKAHS